MRQRHETTVFSLWRASSAATRSMTPADVATIEDAAATLDGIAADIQISTAKGPDHSDWTGEEDSKREHDRLRELVAKLYDLAERGRA